MEKTTNYQLNQWAPDDKVQRIDFNADNAKIDAALAAVASAKADRTALAALQTAFDTAKATIPKIAVGTYTGNGAASQSIQIGFRPKAVLIMREDGSTRYETSVAFCYGGLVLDGSPIRISSGSGPTPITCAEITSSGFRVYYNEGSSSSVRSYLNTAHTFHYLAIG